eukprot:TRINITY_DN8983_c1_g1_i1.p1 TRINITY_DN8983_c1_g1~~TRINITY_DN8983_c1_g1_i1.p1  ORF type:complete len:204 (+),score=29.22 TRINITY_DN8983_c1_g1_i1:71-613(+)
MAQLLQASNISMLLLAVMSVTLPYLQATEDTATCERSITKPHQKTDDKNGEDQAEDESSLLQLLHNSTSNKAANEKIVGEQGSSNTCCTSDFMWANTYHKSMAKSLCKTAADLACAAELCSGHHCYVATPNNETTYYYYQFDCKSCSSRRRTRRRRRRDAKAQINSHHPSWIISGPYTDS